MKRAFRKSLLAFLLIFVSGLTLVQAQTVERLSEVEAEVYGNYALVNTQDYTAVKNIRRYWVQEMQRLKQFKQLECVLTGGNETILKVTIPARILFLGNDSTMLSAADNVLRPFVHLLKGNAPVATLIVAGYSDNNGSDRYLTALSGGRARQVHRWFARQGVGPADVRSYGFANRVPRTDNTTIARREKNRRISLYFVPNKKMIRNARKGKL